MPGIGQQPAWVQDLRGDQQLSCHGLLPVLRSKMVQSINPNSSLCCNCVAFATVWLLGKMGKLECKVPVPSDIDIAQSVRKCVITLLYSPTALAIDG